MDRRALTRLRVAFLLLAAALLAPLWLLLRSVDARMEAQRRLRHELVAERIFDEMEGELTALLAREDARPSAAYAATSTRVENWAPFVVGYFTRDAQGVQIVAKPQLEAARVSRLEATLKRAAGGMTPTAGGARAVDTRAEEAQPAEPTVRVGPAQSEPASAEKQRRRAASDRAQGDSPDLSFFEEPPLDPEAQKRKADEYRAMERKGTGLGAAPAPAQKVQAAPEAVLKQLNRAADTREREAPRSKRKAASTRDDTDPLGGLE